MADRVGACGLVGGPGRKGRSIAVEEDGCADMAYGDRGGRAGCGWDGCCFGPEEKGAWGEGWGVRRLTRGGRKGSISVGGMMGIDSKQSIRYSLSIHSLTYQPTLTTSTSVSVSVSIIKAKQMSRYLFPPPTPRPTQSHIQARTRVFCFPDSPHIVHVWLEGFARFDVALREKEDDRTETSASASDLSPSHSPHVSASPALPSLLASDEIPQEVPSWRRRSGNNND